MSGPRGRGPGRKVRREEHVAVTFDKDGLRSVVPVDQLPAPAVAEPAGAGEYGEPCYTCPCCLKWTETLELLRAHVIAHVARVPALFPCPEECLVCQANTWTTT